MLAALPLIATSCVTTGPAKIKPSAYCPKPDPMTICTGWKPIILHGHDADVLDARTVAEILGHDKYGVAIGCWKAPK